MRLKELGEFGFIKEISKKFTYDVPEIIKGIGDDASVTLIDGERCLLATTDTLIEDVHFTLDSIPAYVLGRKCVSVSLSDIAAMGGDPRYLLLSLSIPEKKKIDLAFFNYFFRGVKEVTDAFGVRLIGGDTSSSKGSLYISVTVFGEVLKDRVVFRSGARIGDRIFVTGTLGDSAYGLRLWKRQKESPVTDPFQREAMLIHIDPAARVEEGRAIAEKGLASSMIDISDGLLSDLRHIMEDSKVGARIYLSMIPISTALKRHLHDNPDDIELILAGGEDYELLFTSSPDKEEEIKRLSDEIKCPIASIGEIVPEDEGLIVIGKDEKPIELKEYGFDHFKHK